MVFLENTSSALLLDKLLCQISRPAGGGKGAQGLAINGNKLSKDAAINKRWKDWKLAQCLEIQKELWGPCTIQTMF